MLLGLAEEDSVDDELVSVVELDSDAELDDVVVVGYVAEL